MKIIYDTKISTEYHYFENYILLIVFKSKMAHIFSLDSGWPKMQMNPISSFDSLN